jgi:hypothetical protein
MRKEALGVAVAVLVVASLGVGYLAGGGRTTTVTITTTSDAYEQVANAYQAHLSQLEVRDVSALASEYESNATIYWTGAADDVAGNYSGSTSIKILMGNFVGKSVTFSLSNESQSLSVEGSVAVVNSTFSFVAILGAGVVNGTVAAQDVYEHAGGSSWLIASETWNFIQLKEPFPFT